MATRLSVPEDMPFSLQIKELADEELLDFWAETQEMEGLLRAEYNDKIEPDHNYERMIILELQLRASQRQSFN